MRPIAGVVAHLRESEGTGLLPEFRAKPASIQEIRDLTESFNRAANAIREARENLHRAYLEFTGSLASALDARDRLRSTIARCAPGHSSAMGLTWPSAWPPAHGPPHILARP